MKKAPTLGLSMITKNEEKYLSNCLDSIKDIVDEIVIVDSGSTDKTLDIAKKYKANIYFKNWEDDFSTARNYALSKSTSDWVLLLDADEELESEFRNRVLELISDCNYDGYYFKVYNYHGDSLDDGYSIHNAFRLLRNDNKYFYSGSIHEQITPHNTTENSIFNTCDVVIKHYGYLNENISAKNKRGRNIPLLEKELLHSPNNPFYMYSLGNEYAALKENDKAIELYNKARVMLTTLHGFAPSLYYKLITVLYNNKKYEIGIKRSKEAIILFPEYVEFQYLNGLLHRRLYQYTMAMDSLNKCIELGDTEFKFIEGCGTYLPYLLLGEIFEEVHDYAKAINSYNNAVIINKKCSSTIYNICSLLNKVYRDKNKIVTHIRSYFNDLDNSINLTLFLDILINNNIIDEIKNYIDRIDKLKVKDINEYYILGKYNFKIKKYSKALNCFEKILFTTQTTKNILIQDSNIIYMASLILLKEDLRNFSKDALEYLKNKLSKPIISNILLLSNNITSTPQLTILTEDYKILLDIYDILLKEKELTTFYKYIPLLDSVSSKEKYVDIAKILYNNGFSKDSIKYIKRSMTTYDYIDKECSRILMLES